MIEKFYGRKNELEILNEAYDSDKFSMIVLYGRRRVGKTSLLIQWLKDKRGIYYVGAQEPLPDLLKAFSQQIMEYFGNGLIDITFSSFKEALTYVFEQSLHERVVLVLDEFPYMDEVSQGLSSVLQNLIDAYKDRSKLMLILCGSSVSFMEEKVLAYQAPLYGRRTGLIKLQPFSFKESCMALHNFSDMDKFLVYGAVGGTPMYLGMMQPELSFSENLKNTFFKAWTPLHTEGESFLQPEVKDVAVYNQVVKAIANGATRLNDISNKSGLTTANCTYYLKKLISLGWVKQVLPYQEHDRKKGIYQLNDQMVEFWYRMVPQNRSLIETQQSDRVLHKVEGRLPEYYGFVFEKVCIEYLWELLKKDHCPVDFTDIGRWWGNDPIMKQQSEIDIVGDDGEGNWLFGECKWKNEPVSQGVLDQLVQKSRPFPVAKAHYYLFSKTGFTDACKEKAENMGNVSLVSFEDLMKVIQL